MPLLRCELFSAGFAALFSTKAAKLNSGGIPAVPLFIFRLAGRDVAR